MTTTEPQVDAPAGGGAVEIALVPVEVRVLEVEIKGITPLIVNRFSEKAKQTMLDAQRQKTRLKKAPKDPDADYRASLYVLTDGRYGFPASGFKSAIVNACSHYDNLTKVLTKQAIFVIGEGPEQLVPIVGEPVMREDHVRLSGTTTDLRHRGQFTDWSATLRIRHVASALSADSVVNLLNTAGLGGIGEWRPSARNSSSGSYGMFEVVQQ